MKPLVPVRIYGAWANPRIKPDLEGAIDLNFKDEKERAKQTDERKKKFDFSDPYFDSGVVMGVSKNSTIKSYEDLKGKKIAIKTGTEGATFAESIKDKYGFTVSYFEDSANMYEDVRTGNSVACFEDYPVLGYGISKGVGLKIVTPKEQGSSYGFAVKNGLNAELLKKFNKGLADIKANGTYQKILDTYIKK